MPIVEVIQGGDSDPAIVEGVIDVLRAIGKILVPVKKDTPGFIGNRLQHALWREPMALVQEGICDAESVDLVARNSIGLRLSAIGPLEIADYVGLDLTRAIHQYVFSVLITAQKPFAILEDAVAAWHLGAKTGVGLSKWADGHRESTRQRLAERVQLLLT